MASKSHVPKLDRGVWFSLSSTDPISSNFLGPKGGRGNTRSYPPMYATLHGYQLLCAQVSKMPAFIHVTTEMILQYCNFYYEALWKLSFIRFALLWYAEDEINICIIDARRILTIRLYLIVSVYLFKLSLGQGMAVVICTIYQTTSRR